MYKALQLHACLFVDLMDLIKRKLSCQYCPMCPFFFQKFHTAHSAESHLCAGMNIKLREPALNAFHHTCILYDHCIQSMLHARFQIIIQFSFKFLVLQQSIDCQIQFYPIEVRIIDSFQKPVSFRILCIGSCSEPAASHIDRICSCMNGCFETFKGSGRCQNLQFLLFHLLLLMITRTSTDGWSPSYHV